MRVWEETPPPGEAPIEWLLVTNVCVDSTDAILRTVDRYRARWTIVEAMV
ncbi:MAG: hypothetical protein ABTD50_08655 [Polyangiaceae bacterium]